MKKFAAVGAALTLMIVGTVSLAGAEVKTDGDNKFTIEEGSADAYCEDGQIGAEASCTYKSRTEKDEHSTFTGTIGDSGAGVRGECVADDDHTSIGVRAEAITAKAGGTVGSRDSVEAGLSLGIVVGAHCDVGYEDGHVKLEAGAALSIGVDTSIDINVGGLWNSICSWFD